ncbi:MAG: hypothetical protein ACR2NN_24020 [Bryobacteraceae bacterium]
MKVRPFAACAGFLISMLLPLQAETNLERGKRIIDECVAALGGDKFLNMDDRLEEGRAYSFYREQLNGLTIAKIYTRYLPGVKDTANTLAVREREFFGKKDESSVLFLQDEAFDINFRGARPIVSEQFARYKETTLRNILYILRIRLHEPGMVFESRGADVLSNRAVEILDVADVQNRVTTVYFDRITKLPVRQIFLRRNTETKEKDEEVTEFSKYRDIGGVQWPFAIHRERNGEKTYEMYSETGEVNKKTSGDLFVLPSTIKLLKKVAQAFLPVWFLEA